MLAVLATGRVVIQCADSIRIAFGRGKVAESEANSADGSDGSIGSVGAPWERKSVGKRVMAESVAYWATEVGFDNPTI
ncbi:hypothetical protein PBS_07830 [Paraburkholderia sp. 2C]